MLPSRPTRSLDRPDVPVGTKHVAARSQPAGKANPHRHTQPRGVTRFLMAAAAVVVIGIVGGAFVTLQSLARDPERPLFSPAPALAGVLPSGTPKPWATRHPAGTAVPDKTKPPAPTRRPDRSPRPRPSTVAYVNPGPSFLPDGRIVYTLRGDEYEDVDVPDSGTFTERPDGSVLLETIRLYSYQLILTYALPEDVIPVGKTITRVDTRVCGSGEGDFWETYGPEGGDTLEHEVSAPGADGCWHYEKAPGFDTSVIAIIRLGSKMTIEKVEYTITVE